jgi:hypothetical protein
LHVESKHVESATCTTESPAITARTLLVVPYLFTFCLKCGVSLRDRVPSEELGAWVGAELISDVCRRNRLRWFRHVERKGDDDWVKRCTKMEVVGKRPRGRPRKTWLTTLKDDMIRGALSPEDARDRGLWRKRIHGAKWPTRVNLDIP